jgi:hypothetical protein
MSIKVKLRADGLHLKLVDHQLREILDRHIEEITNKPCDKGVADLSDKEFIKAVEEAYRRYRKRKLSRKEISAYT